MSRDTVSFYLPDREGLQGRALDALDADRDWDLFGTGLYIWILQTFLRLRAAGAPVRVEAAPKPSSVVVAYADHVERLLSESSSAASLTLVCVRADRRPQTLADLEIVQNQSSAGRYCIFIPSWLQPGLIPRDPHRGTRVEAVTYMGTRQQLHEELASPAWADALRARRLRWDERAVAFLRSDHVYSHLRWNDYSAVDVVVALRPPSTWNVRVKPAAKLQNAWAAGVPAILSPELPYRELRRSRLDYLEVSSPSDALLALDMLRSNPELYASMVENGLERAREFGAERLIERWTDVLWQEVPIRAWKLPHRRVVRARRRWKSKSLSPP